MNERASCLISELGLKPGFYWYSEPALVRAVPGEPRKQEPFVVVEKREAEPFVRFTNGRHEPRFRSGTEMFGPITFDAALTTLPRI